MKPHTSLTKQTASTTDPLSLEQQQIANLSQFIDGRFGVSSQPLFDLTLSAIEAGHTCVSLDPQLAMDWRNHPLVCHADQLIALKDQIHLQAKPFVMSTATNTLWLHRQWAAEYRLASKLKQIAEYPVEPFDITTSSTNEQQTRAIQVASQHGFSLITGGPGTGKTYTVAQLVIALDRQHTSNSQGDNKGLSIALAAPTGKAAKRMQEALTASLAGVEINTALDDAKTIHRLIGMGQSGQPRYHANNPISADLVIIDEASMLGLDLAYHLVDAIPLGARLIFLGDANQLAAVDAGAVLSDLTAVPALQPYCVELTISRRFDDNSGVGKLAHYIKHADKVFSQEEQQEAYGDLPAANTSNDVDTSSDYDGYLPEQRASIAQTAQKIQQLVAKYAHQLSLTPMSITQPSAIAEIYQQFEQGYQEYVDYLLSLGLHRRSAQAVNRPTSDQIELLFGLFNQYRILTAGHHGRFGVGQINQLMRQYVSRRLRLPKSEHYWYHGQPVMLNRNNYMLGLFNGDIGICLRHDAEYWLYFPDHARPIAAKQVIQNQTTSAFAMTIHKSQGSEFDRVATVVSPEHQRLLGNALVYTAITRAKTYVDIYADSHDLSRAILTKTNRQTGLVQQFATMTTTDTR